MKKQLLSLAIVGQILALTARAAEPLVTVTVLKPRETSGLIYAPLGALSAATPPTGRLWFKLGIQNNSGATLTLTGIRVTLPGLDVLIPRTLPCVAGVTTATALSDSEVVTNPHPAAASVTLRLYFAGNPTPKSVVLPLAPYAPATPNGQYLFPADEGDIGPDEYFSAGNVHSANEDQAWGVDWGVYRIVAPGQSTDLREGAGDPPTNEDHVGWGVPIRAVADGVVLRTSTGWTNNPNGMRAFQLMSEFDGEAISDVKVTRLNDTRAASLQRLPSGQVQLSIWQMTNVSRQITRLGSSPIGPTVTEMALDALSDSRVASIVRLNNGNARVIVWDILDDGQTVTNIPPLDSAGVLEVSLMRMSLNRFATGVRTAAGNLEVSVWEANGASLRRIATDSAGAATSICTTALSGSRVAISLITAGGFLKVIVWDLVDAGRDTYTLDRRGEKTAGAIKRVAACVASKGTWEQNRWVTAMVADPGDFLKLIRWDAPGDGMTITNELETTTSQVIQDTALAVSIATGDDPDSAATASIIAGNVFQINGWGDPDGKAITYDYSATNAAGTVTTVSIDETDQAEERNFFVGARTTGGALKIMMWRWAHGAGNSVYVLHGDCRVEYHHFQDGSVNTNVIYPGATVAAGQILGRMGNSGSSGGPHTHIHSERIHPDVIALGPQEVLARQVAGTLRRDFIGPKPMPFSGARAMERALIAPGGEDNGVNSFATMNGQGMYDVKLGIRPRLNTRYLDRTSLGANPTGRKEVVPPPPIFGAQPTGGPYRSTVAQAVNASPPGTRLYIRGGNYNEAAILDKPMLLRRYDYYDTSGSVLIGR
jgi:hypothetical protein